jgi:hypothetical protein
MGGSVEGEKRSLATARERFPYFKAFSLSDTAIAKESSISNS